MKRTTAIICASLLFPAAFMASALTAVYFKSVNPDNVDVTQGLAYLGQSLLAAVIVAVVLLIACLAYSLMTYREEGAAAAKLPLGLLAVNVAFIIGIALTNAQVNRVQDRYLIDHGRPTLHQFFETMKAQQQK